MSLHRKLLALLVTFAAFSLIATLGTIYAVRVHVQDAMADLRQNQAVATWLEHLRLTARSRCLALREVTTGLRDVQDLDTVAQRAFFEEMQQVARFTLQHGGGDAAEETLALTAALRTAFEEVHAALQNGQATQARQILITRIEGELLPALDRRLRQTGGMLAEARGSAVDRVVAANTQLLVLAVVVGVLGGGLIAVGTLLIRRWLLNPVRQLEEAAQALGTGDLSHRVALGSRDEFGRLGRALDDMADKLTRTQADLSHSEAKYRSLFSNLRDATLICDASGRIVECHDGETALLARLAGECLGQSLLDICPDETATHIDWPSVFGRTLTRGERVRVTDIRLQREADNANAAIVDVIAFPVQWGDGSAVAVVLRDVTEQRRSESRLRRTEAMEATVTLARGVAHDFSSLLTSAIGSLSVVSSEIGNGRAAELVRRALRACGQAVTLSRTLLTFAGGERGTPEALNLRETIELIVESLDEECVQKVAI